MQSLGTGTTPIIINQEACLVVNVQEEEDPTSTGGVLQAVKINGKVTLSLGGTSLDTHDSKN